MKRLLPLALFSLLAGCGGQEVQLPKVEVKPYQKLSGGTKIATVNDAEIKTSDLDERVSHSPYQTAAEVTPDKKKELLEDLIKQEVLYQEAKSKGYAEHPRVKMMMVSLLQHDALAPAEQIQIKDEETKKYFDTHKEEFVIPEKVRARRIGVVEGADKTGARAKIDEIRKAALQTPNDFGKIAQDRSEAPEKTRQGELGYFDQKGRTSLDPKIVTEAFKVKENGISGVFETTENGVTYLNIVKVETRAARTERSYDQVKKSIERKLLTDRRTAMLDNYVAELKNKAQIKTDDGALAAYTPTIAPRPQFPQMMQQFQQMGAAGHPETGNPGVILQPAPNGAVPNVAPQH